MLPYVYSQAEARALAISLLEVGVSEPAYHHLSRLLDAYYLADVRSQVRCIGTTFYLIKSSNSPTYTDDRVL